MPSRNLEPGQLQIGDTVFGFGTQLNIESFDIGGHEVTNQDRQSQDADETLFGSDQLKALPIQFIINAFKDEIVPNMVALTGDTRELNFSHQNHVSNFSREWRADDIRKAWGALKNLYVCRKDGRVVELFGRPGKFQVSREEMTSNYQKIVAEFRRSDTFAYTDFEWFTTVRDGEIQTVYRSTDLGQGDAPCWLRFFIVGPMTNPIIQLGTTTIELAHEIEAGEIVEISSYPWQRRVIDLGTGNSLAAKLVQPNSLRQLKMSIDEPIRLSWNATSVNQNIEAEDFSGYSNTTEGLPSAAWHPTSYSSGTGSAKISSGELIWVDSGNQNRTGAFIYKEPTASIYQYVGITVASPSEDTLFGEARCANRIIGRCNDDRTEYLYWDITYTECWYGYHKNGIDYMLSEVFVIRDFCQIVRDMISDFFSIFGATNPQDDWKYEAQFGTGEDELGSTLNINDHKAFTFEKKSNPGANVQISQNSKLTGFGLRATTRAAGQSTPGPVSEFHMRDNKLLAPNVSSVTMLWRDAWQNI